MPVGCSRHLQPQVDGICVLIWLDHEWHEFSRMGRRAGRLRALGYEADVACKVERVSRAVWHCPGLTRNGPGDPFYMGRRRHEDLSTLWAGGIREIKSHRCKSVFFFRRSRPLQPQVDGICVLVPSASKEMAMPRSWSTLKSSARGSPMPRQPGHPRADLAGTSPRSGRNAVLVAAAMLGNCLRDFQNQFPGYTTLYRKGVLKARGLAICRSVDLSKHQARL